MNLTLMNAEAITVNRPSEDAALDQDTGLYPDDSTTTFTTTASIQPMKGRDLLLLPEADRIRHSERFYSQTELLDGDQVTRDKNGDVFFIRTDQDWSTQLSGVSYYKVIGFLKDDTA